jgi:topoisomerase-4 subunit A
MIELQDGAKIAQALADGPESSYLFANSGGYGFVARLADLVTRQKAGKAFLTLEAGERVLAPARVAEGATEVACVSERARLLLFALAEVKVQSGGRGVILMGLDEGESLVAVAVFGGNGLTVDGTGRGGKVKQVQIGLRELPRYRLHRARRGSVLPERIEPSGFVVTRPPAFGA